MVKKAQVLREQRTGECGGANRSDVDVGDAGSEEGGKVGQGALRGGRTRKPLKRGEMASSEATRHRHSLTQSGHSSVL